MGERDYEKAKAEKSKLQENKAEKNARTMKEQHDEELRKFDNETKDLINEIALLKKRNQELEIELTNF